MERYANRNRRTACRQTHYPKHNHILIEQSVVVFIVIVHIVNEYTSNA